MRTAELIAALAAQSGPAPRHPVARRLAPAMVVGVAAAFVLLLLSLGLRPLGPAMHSGSFWMKAAYTASIAAAALWLVAQMARPEGRPGWRVWLAAVPLAVMAGLGAIEVAAVAPQARLAMLLGVSWSICPRFIVLLAAPIFLAAVFALRRLAPTRLATTGACAGLLAGAAGATVYGLFCRESSAAFVAVWYTLGMAICAAIGAALGPRLLRW
jgi:hypothetical protein